MLHTSASETCKYHWNSLSINLTAVAKVLSNVTEMPLCLYECVYVCVFSIHVNMCDTCIFNQSEWSTLSASGLPLTDWRAILSLFTATQDKWGYWRYLLAGQSFQREHAGSWLGLSLFTLRSLYHCLLPLIMSRIDHWEHLIESLLNRFTCTAAEGQMAYCTALWIGVWPWRQEDWNQQRRQLKEITAMAASVKAYSLCCTAWRLS